MRLHLLSLFLLLAACTTPAPGTGDGPAAGDGAQTLTDGPPARGDAGPGAPDGSPPTGDGGAGGCIGLDECACKDHGPTCQPLVEPCWCPFPECGPGECLCGGGKFYGCAPAASHCDTNFKCLPAGRPSPQDPKGCVTCTYQSDCQQAFDQMVGTCGNKAKLTNFSCQKNPECVTKCINSLAKCEDVGCGLCNCGCSVMGAFEQCYFKCVR